MRELTKSRDCIIFIDELHTLVGAGSAEGSMDAANILKPALSRGEIQCIGATTPSEYRKYIGKDRSLERRFQAVKVSPPDEEEAVTIHCRTSPGRRSRSAGAQRRVSLCGPTAPNGAGAAASIHALQHRKWMVSY